MGREESEFLVKNLQLEGREDPLPDKDESTISTINLL